MPEDIKIRVRPEGIKAAVKELNDAADAADRVAATAKARAHYGTELARLAREQRAAAFAQLPAERQLAVLLQRQERLKRFMARAEGDETRALQLKLALKRTEVGLEKARAGSGLLGKGRELMAEIPGGSAAMRAFDLVGARAAAAGAAVFAFAGATNRAQALSDLSVTLQLSTERLQSLQFAAESTGTSFESVTRGILNVRKTSADALRGEVLMQQAFADLGVSLNDLRTLSGEDVFLKISAALSDGNVSAREYNALLRVMEEEGRALLPAFTKGLGEIANRFQESGRGSASAWTAALAEVGDSWDRLAANIKTGFGTALDFASYGVIRLADDFHKGVAAMTGDLEKLAELQAAELLQRDPDYQAGVERAREMQRDLDRRREAAGSAATGDADKRAKEADKLAKLEAEIQRIFESGLPKADQRELIGSQIQQKQQSLSASLVRNFGIVGPEEKATELEILKLQQRFNALGNTAPVSLNTESLAAVGRSRGGNGAGEIVSQLSRLIALQEQQIGKFDHPLPVMLTEQ